MTNNELVQTISDVLDDKLTTFFNTSIFPTIIGWIITLLVAGITIFATAEREAHANFLNKANHIYVLTFQLREEISLITRKKYNTDFYFELDLILQDEEISNKILDYLNEIETFFCYTQHLLSRRSFKKFVSKAFYNRLLMTYCYILYLNKNIKENKKKLFQNNIKVIKNIKNNKRIKSQMDTSSKKCYIGIRESDISFSKEYFSHGIFLFYNSKQQQFKIRPNQNNRNKELFTYYNTQLEKSKQCAYKYVFYNQATAYNYPREIIDNSLYVNKKEILDLFNNKLLTKQLLIENDIKVVPFQTFAGKDILYSQLTAQFNCKSFVIQTSHGGGGIGTYLLTTDSYSRILTHLEHLQNYMVSPYIEKSISVNTHVFVSEKQTVLSPGSIQIIEKHNDQLCYRGGDFVAFRKIDHKTREKIKYQSLKIANLLRQKGYIGIAGIDFIIGNNGELYCSEINPRFQASTFMLDRYLKEKTSKSVGSTEADSTFVLNEMAFKGGISTDLCFEDEINYSCYYYYCDDNLEYIKEKIKILEKANIKVDLDGLKSYFNENSIDRNSYMFKATFDHAICNISPDGNLWISDNVKISHKPKNILQLKIALLNQGVRLDKKIKNVKNGSYDSIDIIVKKYEDRSMPININCAYGIHLSHISPYYIKKETCDDEFSLYFYNTKLATVNLEEEKLIKFSEQEKNMLFIATDRLRIKLLHGCDNKSVGKGCYFCNISHTKYEFSEKEIETAIQKLKDQNIEFRHILIGGGTCLASDSWDRIIRICKILKDNGFENKPISLMSVLPPQNILPKLKEAGIDEVAFNLEISNDSLAKDLMPNKRSIGKKAYYEIFEEATKIFTTVRSALLVGIDTEQDLYDEIFTLSQMKVQPCLSPYRILTKTVFEGDIGPENEYLEKIYKSAIEILEKGSSTIKKLGPNCEMCKNNMLIL